MYRLLSAVPFYIITLIFFKISLSYTSVKIYDLFISIYVIAFLIALGISAAALITTLVEAASQLKRFEEILERFNRIKIKKKKQNTLISELKIHAKEYRDFEKEIFESIKPESISTYLVKFPELKGSEIVLTLINEITKIETDLTSEDLNIEESHKKVRVCKGNPWYIRSLIPKLPEDLKEKMEKRLEVEE
jgi:hypothetical protein